jgi:molybdopterin-guanine dinucleotide biosynthesis adapter protein
MLIVAVVGNKKSGKTTTTENLIREMTKRGYKVAAIKHVHEPNFTIDTPKKDTYRYAQSGAKTILAISATEIATIEKIQTDDLSLETFLHKCKGNDIVFIEGLKEQVAKKSNILKISVNKNQDEATSAQQTYKPILAFSGSYNTEKLNAKIPYIDALTNAGNLADLIELKLGK